MEKLPRVDRVLDDLRSLGAEIIDFDFGYPVEEATFEQGATESRIEAIAAVIGKPLPSDYAYFLSRCAGFTGMDFQNGYVVHGPKTWFACQPTGGRQRHRNLGIARFPSSRSLLMAVAACSCCKSGHRTRS